ncbi:FGGY-family carbohydrate kinase [Aurantimonas sp. Leaf443]|uniref:xylulokinase n=1 Tax=Aurantimonas sp. Leaf443 TaxID=1736378 RepID=UPI0006F210AE|nr:FGGY-family carbohydrate kinase [Aurantimonas sp. Leaf443]KQT85264.1 xylulose kinase [Aurantimonas sp. Leaf443]
MNERPHVIGLDSSTQSTKAVVWDRSGAIVAEARAGIAMTHPRPGHAEQDPQDWWAALVSTLKEVAAAVGPQTIAGLAISNQRETVAFLDADGRSIRPAIVWLDERVIATMDDYAERMGAGFLHETTGKPVDTVPVVYRLDWLRRHEPRSLDAAARILDVHAYLTGRLTGTPTASFSSADPFGLFDIAAMDWSDPILSSVGIERRQLARLVRPGALVGPVNGEGVLATGLLPGTPVFAAGGDGQCAGLGTNAMEEGTVYLNLGTATVSGVFSATPAIGRHWRTMTSPTGDGYFLESIQKAGAFFVNWVVDTFGGGRDDPGVFERLEAEAAALPIGAEGLTMTPHIIGVMNPHWDPRARAAMVGLSASHGRAHIYRAALEALTAEIARGLKAMAGEGIALSRIRAIGGGAKSPLWLQMVADATGLPVERSQTVEASALGAGIIAATGAGWYADARAAARAMTRIDRTVQPRAETAGAWAALVARQERLYHDTMAYRAA